MPPKDVHRQLRHAAWKGDVRLAKKALKRGADVEGMDADFFTPTLIAARWGQVKMLQLLVERHNASLLSRTREGDTAYGLAELYGHTNVAEWLARKGCSTAPNPMRSHAAGGEDERPVSADGPAIPSEEESRTIWVGGIPAHMAADATSATLTSMFEKFGELAAISTRQKPGELKSWAFVTYTERSAAQAALAAAVTCGGVTLQVRPSQVSRHLAENRLHGTQGALASVWQRQMEKEAEWMGSLLGGLNRDTHYQAAKEIIAQNLGLRDEELEDELEDQELEELLLASWDSAHDDGADFGSHDFVQGFSVGFKVGQSQRLPGKAGTGGLGLPPKSAAQHPTGILVPQPEPAPAPTHLGKLSQGRGVSADFMITSQGVTCDV